MVRSDNGWEDWVFKNTADVALGAEFYVAIFAPIGTPRVLYQEVLGSVFYSVANNENGMINACTAVLTCNHSRLVREEVIVGFNSNCDRLLCDSPFELFSIVTLNITPSFDLDNSFGCSLIAFLPLVGVPHVHVLIIRLLHQWGCLGVSVSVGHPSTIAAVI